jgi:GAF domain-containing protein
MLNETSSATNQTSQGREERRQQLLQRLRGDADAVLERLADELVDLPDDQVFGAIEHTLRDLGHDLASRAHQAGIDAGKKRGTEAPAPAAPTAPATPGSSATGRRPS